MSNSMGHPEPATLEAYALGWLGMAEMERVETHLANCLSCGQRLQSVPDDRLVILLRRLLPAEVGLTLPIVCPLIPGTKTP
jgi:hypothetical protein